MAGHGPAPKSPDERARRNIDPIPLVKLHADKHLRGPALPIDLTSPDGTPIRWPAATRRWWDNWRRSPQAQIFTATDWDALTEAALLHRALVSGNPRAAAELRLRVAKLGATPEDRARLRLGIQH